MRQSQEHFPWSMPAFFEDYLHACFSGCGTLHRWVGGMEKLLILEVESLQRKIYHGEIAAMLPRVVQWGCAVLWPEGCNI